MDLPADDADDLTWLLFRQDLVITRRQALEHLTDKAIRHRVRSGRWLQLHRGVLLAHPGPVTLRQRWWAAVLVAAAGGVAYLAGLSALQLLGLKRMDSRAIDVLVPASRDDVRAPIGVRVHRSRCLPGAQLHPAGRPPCMIAARCLIDAVQWAASVDEARLIIVATVQQGLVVGADVTEAMSELSRVRRRGLIMRTVADADSGSHTLAELDLLALCRRAGLPEPSRQVRRVDSDGRNRYLDLYFDEWGVHVEVDGAHHMDVRQWWQDMRRHNALSTYGLRTLRFPAFVVREQPEVVAAQLRSALRAAGWGG